MNTQFHHSSDYFYIIVTAAHNVDKYLGNTIEAIINQTVKPMIWVTVSDEALDKRKTSR